MALRPQPGRWIQLAALSAVPLTMVLGNAMVMPVLPEMGRQLGITRPSAGLAVTAFSLTAGLGIPLTGYLADRYGRKGVVTPALLLFALGAAVAGIGGWWPGAQTFPVVLAGRVLQGLGASGMSYIALAFAGDLFKGQERVSALGILEASGGFGKVLAPVIGALIGQLLAWWGVFLVQALTAILAAIAVWLLTRDPGHHHPRSASDYCACVGNVLRARGAGLLTCFGVGSVNHLVMTGLLFFLSQHLEAVHNIRGVAKGWQLAWPLLALSLLAFGSGLWLRRHHPFLKHALLAGLLTVVAGSLLIALRPDGWSFLLGTLLVGGGSGLQLPALSDLICSATPSSERAGISALYGAVRFSGTAIGPPLFGWLMDRNASLPFLLSASLAGLMAGGTLLLLHPDRLTGNGSGGADGGGESEPGLPVPAWQVPTGLPPGTRGNQ